MVQYVNMFLTRVDIRLAWREAAAQFASCKA